MKLIKISLLSLTILMSSIIIYSPAAFADVNITVSPGSASPDPAYIQNGEYVTFTLSPEIVDVCDGETVYYFTGLGGFFGLSDNLMIHEINSSADATFTPANPFNWPAGFSQSIPKISYTCNSSFAASGQNDLGNGFYTLIQEVPEPPIQPWCWIIIIILLIIIAILGILLKSKR